MRENDVEEIVKEYALKKYNRKAGWIMPLIHKHEKSKGEHGIDISLYNPKLGRRIIIEVKKWSKTSAANHNAFYSIFGQLLSRINEEPSSNYLKKKTMVISAPKEFIRMMHKKINFVKNNDFVGMKGGWSLFGRSTNLRVWSVDMKNKTIIEYHWRDLLNSKFNSLNN